MLLVWCRNAEAVFHSFCFQFHEFYETGACKLISRWLCYVELDSDYAEVYYIKLKLMTFSFEWTFFRFFTLPTEHVVGEEVLLNEHKALKYDYKIWKTNFDISTPLSGAF